MSDESEIINELAAVQDALLALPDDAFAEKYELKKQQDELREKAAQFAVDQDKGRSDADLLSELSGLRSQLAQLEKQKINLVSQAGGGPGESTMGNLGGAGLNIGMMDASDGTRLQARIGVIKGVLSNRGVSMPDPT
ncbi:MAG: hypothetical protein M3132_06730 [Actinomycetia bacterium]|nr:hypothetical protein [Actinomycetes bacterium]